MNAISESGYKGQQIVAGSLAEFCNALCLSAKQYVKFLLFILL